MGGGGTMRAAAKVAGFTVATSGRRVFSEDHYPVSSSIRAAASAHPVEDVNLVASPTQGGVQSAAVSDIDDWIFAGVQEEVADAMPRVVFGGGAPTLQEAKETTYELADALKKAYLSSIADTSFCSSPSNSQVIENKACVTSEIVVKPSATNHAIKAFKLLHESSAAQLNMKEGLQILMFLMNHPQRVLTLHMATETLSPTMDLWILFRRSIVLWWI